MATIDRKGYLRGTLGDVSYREVHGKNILQMRPLDVKRSVKTRLAAEEFGMASNAASVIRKIGAKISPVSDGKMYARLNTVVNQALRNVRKDIGRRNIKDIDPGCLDGFQFNLAAPFERTLSFLPQVAVSDDGQLDLSIPKMDALRDVSFLRTKEGKNCSAYLQLVVAEINFGNGYYQVLEKAEMDIRAATDWEWCIKRRLSASSFIITYISVHYFDTDWIGAPKPVVDKRYNSSGILKAFYVDSDMYRLNRENAEMEDMGTLSGKVTFRYLAPDKLYAIHNELRKLGKGSK